MNRRLVWKIFLPFWVAQALLLGALYLRVHYRISSEHPWWIQPERREMPVLASLAAERYEQQGSAGLSDLLNSLSLPHRSQFWLVDAGGQELTGRAVPDNILRGAAAAEKKEGLYHSYEANVLASRVTTGRGQYLLIAELTPPPLRERIPGDLLWTLKLGTVFSFIICLLIAHYLTKPIERMRDATHELARGNLDIRAGENLGNRHDEIADLVRDFDTMAGELRNQIQSERNLLSGVSHELRSPIARIRLALALARGAGDQERAEMLDRIEQDTVQLDSMLERILEVARLESGQQKPKFEQLALNELMDDVLDDAKFEAAAIGAEVKYLGASEVKVNGDAGLLRSAIENVVRNAIFYSGPSGKIDVQLEKANGAAVITVCDNGPGVPDKALPLLFKPFYRVDDSRGTNTGGMGLGLAIVRNAVAVHGGSVSAKNVSPHGLEVELRLPMVPAPAGRRSSAEVKVAQV
ncbi:MAG TPA: ATP-binding protein [Terriglobales bacterium]|jgi:two-component system sensor histidine kinase CpxA|nr:ATP-binding protein [Terriglobales bacterium]